MCTMNNLDFQYYFTSLEMFLVAHFQFSFSFKNLENLNICSSLSIFNFIISIIHKFIQ